MSAEKLAIQTRPNVYDYLDYRAFLRAWMEYRRGTTEKLTLKSLSEKSSVSIGYLSEVISGKRKLGLEAYNKLKPNLGLDSSEAAFLYQLSIFQDAESPDEKNFAYQKIAKFSGYKNKYKSDINYHEYLRKWLHVAIREMTVLPDFNTDPEWIQSRLKFKPPLSEIKDAVRFLVKSGILKLDLDGKIVAEDGYLHCEGNVQRVAMAQAHREFLDLAVKSIYATERDERLMNLYTMAFPKKQFDEVKKIISEAMQKIIVKHHEVADKDLGDTVYQVSFYAYPLTDSKPGDEGDV